MTRRAKYGLVTIREAYGNWKSTTLKGSEELLHEHAIQPIQQYDLTKGKNASDIAMVIYVIYVKDIMYTKNIDVMCFISSDSDLPPYGHKSLSRWKSRARVWRTKDPLPFINASSKFLFLDDPEKIEAEK